MPIIIVKNSETQASGEADFLNIQVFAALLKWKECKLIGASRIRIWISPPLCVLLTSNIIERMNSFGEQGCSNSNSVLSKKQPQTDFSLKLENNEAQWWYILHICLQKAWCSDTYMFFLSWIWVAVKEKSSYSKTILKIILLHLAISL